ncbi:ImmA/IrrE family metallo-endopeptidase [Clostridium sp. DL1XJH146]
MIPNYNRAVIESIDILQLYEINQVPIDLNIILKSIKRTVKVCSYSLLSNKTSLSIKEICDMFESDLGACTYSRNDEHYVIYYNDTKQNHHLDRFTIAHELGHIFLEHHHNANTDILLRKNISKSQYDKYEKEANCFARNVLSPIPLVDRITNLSHQRSIIELSEAFDISYLAATTRRDLYSADSYRMTSSYYSYFNNYTILYGYYCDNCGNAEISTEGFCKICGQESIPFEKTCNRIFYGGIETDDNKRVIKCPKCGNEVFSKEAHYCKICGTSLYNFCEGEAIVDYYDNVIDYHYHFNDGNARYCKKCGAKTSFFNNGYLDDWNVNTHSFNKRSDALMKYQQNYPVDENMRVLSCPKCSNEVFSEDATYCKLCGTKLFNNCEGEDEYDNYGNVYNTIYHNNPGDARFCETCGKPTYFFKVGFLKTWEDEKEEIEEMIELGIIETDANNQVAATIEINNEEDCPF